MKENENVAALRRAIDEENRGNDEYWATLIDDDYVEYLGSSMEPTARGIEGIGSHANSCSMPFPIITARFSTSSASATSSSSAGDSPEPTKANSWGSPPRTAELTSRGSPGVATERGAASSRTSCPTR
jgi:hypothetical protein